MLDDESGDWVPDGWANATFSIGMATFDPEVNVLLDFTEDRLQKPFTVEAKIAYGIVTPVTWDETPLPERKAGPYSSIIWYNHEFHDEVECGLCANQGQGSWISAGTALCAQCWGEVMAVMTRLQ